MIYKIAAGIVLWLFVTLLISVFISSSNEYLEFHDIFLAANLGMVMLTVVGFVFFKVMPWAIHALFGG